jgi:NAD+ synthase (glutamine-hydrolysing)
MVYDATRSGDQQVIADARRIAGRPVGEDEWLPSSPSELANLVLHTTYMGTENSSEVTKSRAERLAAQIGAHHSAIVIDTMVSAVVGVFNALTGRTPRFESLGGTLTEDLALQNIQARLRMVMAYVLAQLLPWVRGRRGFLLVLGSANVDEGLRGYMTKYDCSSADLNPIGSVSKGDLKLLMRWAAARYNCPALAEVEEAPPTAELRPLVDAGGNDENDTPVEHSQLDEDDMGMSYSELGTFGKLRKIARCGPVSMFRKLVHTWSHLPPSVVADKVKRFFTFYSINRHKMVTITPAYHAEQYSPDDNRFDQRQFLYNTRWPRQFGVIDGLAKGMDRVRARNLAEAKGMDRVRARNLAEGGAQISSL